jgi:hypothetical protein
MVLALAVVVCVSGCGKGPKLVPVSGTVTMDGQPLADAMVTFTYTDHPRPAAGRTDANGAFKLIYNNRVGGPIGSAKVMIRKQGKLDDGELFGELIPRRYHASTTLQYEVTKAGPNEFNIPLTSEKDEADLQPNQVAPEESAPELDDAELDESERRGAQPQRSNQNQPQRKPEEDLDDDGV